MQILPPISNYGVKECKSWLFSTFCSRASEETNTHVHAILRYVLLEIFSSIYNDTNSRHFHLLRDSCHTGIENQGKISHIRHFKCCLRIISVSQSSPLNPGGHKHRYTLSVNPDWQVALFWYWKLLSQALKEKKKLRKKDGEIKWKKEHFLPCELVCS